MRKAKVYFQDQWAGILLEDENGYHFKYQSDYLNKDNPEPISVNFPITPRPYHNKVLFPFFDGLIPEGWLLDIAEKSWKINPRDRMGILLAVCQDCIGAVSIASTNSADHE